MARPATPRGGAPRNYPLLGRRRGGVCAAMDVERCGAGRGGAGAVRRGDRRMHPGHPRRGVPSLAAVKNLTSPTSGKTSLHAHPHTHRPRTSAPKLSRGRPASQSCPPKKLPDFTTRFRDARVKTVPHDRGRARSALRGASPAGARSSSPRGAPESTWLHRRPPGGLAAPLVRRTDFDRQSRERRRRPRALGTTPGARPRPGRGRPAVRRGGRAARPERPSRLAPAVGRARRPRYARRGRRGGGAPTRSGARARPSTRGAPP